jgi:TonB family protein
MKGTLFVAVVASLGFLAQATASAYTTARPAVSLVPLSPVHVAVSAEHTAGCNVAAGVDGSPYFEMPEIASDMDEHGTAKVKIDLTSDGNLAQEELYSSSGSRWLDRAAMRSARLTKFTPEIVGCQRVAGSYLYEVEF